MATNLKKKPYELSDHQIEWVQNTINSMTLEEKIGQLFISMGRSTDEAYIKMLVEKYHIGGARYMEKDGYKVLEMTRLYQKYSKIPVFIATNCEEGGNGAYKQGTLVATQAQCGADVTTDSAYMMGKISGIEATAVGCNWTFSPIVDISKNWRNTIVNTRAFSSDADKVLDRARAYIKGVKENNMLTCAKHFPGDGVEERDQHLVMGINDMTVEEWEANFGKVYRSLIDDGLDAVMVGHIAFPDYSKRFGGITKDTDILPASVAPELINGLLRTDMGYQGLVLTDASHMGGLLGSMPRSKQVPATIAAGCDMFLFFHDPAEDIQYMMDGYKNGIITEERLQDALEHILGMKAKLGMDTYDYEAAYEEQKMRLESIDFKAHQKIAEKIAKDTITLVKDTQHLLPIDVSKKKRARLYYLETAPMSIRDQIDPTRQIVVEELEAAGFSVDINPSFYEADRWEIPDMRGVYQKPPFEKFKEDYDVVFVFVRMASFAQENNVRIKYSGSHTNELPWWTRDVPTVCVSLNYTNHLFDLPMMKTYINAYAPTRACIKATIDKIIGKESFTGTAEENVWCGRWETRL